MSSFNLCNTVWFNNNTSFNCSFSEIVRLYLRFNNISSHNCRFFSFSVVNYHYLFLCCSFFHYNCVLLDILRYLLNFSADRGHTWPNCLTVLNYIDHLAEGFVSSDDSWYGNWRNSGCRITFRSYFSIIYLFLFFSLCNFFNWDDVNFFSFFLIENSGSNSLSSLSFNKSDSNSLISTIINSTNRINLPFLNLNMFFLDFLNNILNLSHSWDIFDIICLDNFISIFIDLFNYCWFYCFYHFC